MKILYSAAVIFMVTNALMCAPDKLYSNRSSIKAAAPLKHVYRYTPDQLLQFQKRASPLPQKWITALMSLKRNCESN